MAAEDKCVSLHIDMNAPAIGAFSITPHDTNELTYITRGVLIGNTTGGNAMKVDMQDGTTVTLNGLTTGTIYALRVRKVYDAGTTASSIIGLY